MDKNNIYDDSEKIKVLPKYLDASQLPPEVDSGSVVFNPDPEEINIHGLTRVNNQIIYQVNTRDCIRYISIDGNIEYVGFIFNEKLHIFSLVTREIPDEMKRYFFHINEEILNILTNKVNNAKSMIKIINSFKKIPNFVFIHKHKLKCIHFRDLTEVKARIKDLNAALHQTCPGFSLNIDYIYRLSNPTIVSVFSVPFDGNTLLLCLFNGNNCISSLELNINTPNDISISSRTNKLYENRKYNKLLRAIIIIIAKLIDTAIQRINSEAINPVSAYLMLHSFNAIYINRVTKKILNKYSTYEEIEDELNSSESRSIVSSIELNDENNANARRVFEEIIENINCGPVTEGGVVTLPKIGGRRKTKRHKRRGKKRSRKCS